MQYNKLMRRRQMALALARAAETTARRYEGVNLAAFDFHMRVARVFRRKAQDALWIECEAVAA